MKQARKAALTRCKKVALAASSLSTLALLPAGAQAGIVFHNTAIGPNTPTSNNTWDVDGSGGTTFKLNGTNSSRVAARLNSDGARGQGLVQKNSQSGSVFQNLALNVVVGPSLGAGYKFGSASQSDRWVASSRKIAGTANGFSSGVPGYIGFKFTDAGGSNLYYGWAEITIDAPNTAYTINEWAYNSTAGGSISVGDTGVSAVPEPSALSLALIGLGAGGVLAWRRRKQAQALTA